MHAPLLYFLNITPPTEYYTLSLHDALPIFEHGGDPQIGVDTEPADEPGSKSRHAEPDGAAAAPRPLDYCRKDRKSTRLNSSHMSISYAVFCLKKKKK